MHSIFCAKSFVRFENCGCMVFRTINRTVQYFNRNKGWFTRATQTQTQAQTQAQGSSHVQRKGKHSAIRKRNRVFQDGGRSRCIGVVVFLFLGLRRIRRRCLIQRNNKPRPKRLWVREIFQKRQLFPFLSQHLPF